MKIEMKNISKDSILKDISITFESGKIYGITSSDELDTKCFLKVLCSFYKLDAGKILKDGYCYSDKNEFPTDTRALLDKPDFISELSGFENLKVIAKILNKINDNEIYETMKIFDIYEDRNILVDKYLYGMKKKLALASVFMENPKVIILDNPFDCIEKTVVKDIKEYFKQQKDKLIIISSPNKEELEDLCNEIYEIKEGKLIKL